MAGGEVIGAGAGGAAGLCRATRGAAAFGLGAAFFATLARDLAFFGAAAFFATLRAVPPLLALAFTGRAFFFAALFLTALRLPLAIERFFDLLFFAMITLLLEIVRTRCESSPEKVCCHLCVMLESVGRIA